MKNTLVAGFAALALVAGGTAFAADTAAPSAHAQKAFKMITIPELVSLQKANKVSVFDANGDDTRAKYGVIPGATLLTDLHFDAAKVLPANKSSKVVFYCANQQCGASHQAAERAIGAGYTDVSVLGDGIMGWKKSGQPTVTPKNS